MQVEQDPEAQNWKGLKRFDDISCPEWMKLDITPPKFDSTQYLNNILALFHYN